MVIHSHAWVIPLKCKKGEMVAKAFQKIMNNSSLQSNKKSVDKGEIFENKSMKS